MKKEKAFTPVLAIIFILLFIIIATVVVFAIISFSTTGILVNPEKAKMTTFPDELGLQYEFCEIVAPNGATMAGWFIAAQKHNSDEKPTPSPKTVVFSHDYKSNKDMEEINGLYYARYLCEAGYNVLTFDYSGSGSSTGKGYTFGSREVQELNAVVSFVKDKYKSTEISLCGWGFGAAVAVMAGSDNPDVNNIISDGAYSDLREVFNTSLHYLSGAPSFLNSITEGLIPLLSGHALYADSPIDAVKRAQDKHFFFIQGQSDDLFSPECISYLAAAAGQQNTVEKWQVKGTNHIYSFKTNEENYVDRTIRFLKGESVFSE
ncbi:MAG: hypothetical protein DBX47_02095 [Clostridiales bacterium]|nr:MAG: hypothetical protein DBX47_02095 [Clostridiales bacterium]